MKSNRSTIDQDVDLAFHLLTDYRGLLEPSRHDPDPHLEHARDQLEQVMRKWFPRALASGDRVLAAMSKLIGKRAAAAKRLSKIDLMRARVDCLRAVAKREIDARLMSDSAALVCGDEIKHWRQHLPYVRQRPDGSRHIERADVQAELSRTMYWSINLTEWPSWRGASYSLAAACEALARWAHSERGITLEHLRPVSRLVHRLGEQPDWRIVEPHVVVRVVDEQVDLVRQTEELLVELDFASPRAIDAPQLVPHQLPAMVLVTVLELGSVEKRRIQKLPGVRESDRARIANLLTPGGELSRRSLLHSERAVVALTDAGRAEAEMQQQHGTASLVVTGTHDNSP